MPESTLSDTVIVAMSGGVDSSVTALRLLEDGYAVAGMFMKNWEEDDGTGYCTAKEDLADAQAVADKLGIRLHVANFSAEYWDQVFEHFLAEYRGGRTPNPDVLCNREIKFKAFVDYARQLGAGSIATGHYARLRKTSDRCELLRGLDPNKDQSYFLHAVSSAQLQPALFPIGELEKPEVRRLARDAGFPTHAKKDSTGICFIGERRFSDFIRKYVDSTPGPIEDWDGTQVGTHQGLAAYTVGQRSGLNIGGRKDGSGEPWYVIDRDHAGNRLIVGQGSEHPALYCHSMECREMNWINEAPHAPFSCTAKIRYRQQDQHCNVTPAGPDTWRVHFAAAQRAVTPGQYCVFYDGEICLGGGVIQRRLDGPAASQEAI